MGFAARIFFSESAEPCFLVSWLQKVPMNETNGSEWPAAPDPHPSEFRVRSSMFFRVVAVHAFRTGAEPVRPDCRKRGNRYPLKQARLWKWGIEC